MMKKSFLNSQHIDIFLKGLTHNFGQTMEILSFFVFGQKDLEIMFDDHWSRKQALLEYKKLAITKSPYWNFLEGLTYDFDQKFLFVCFWVKWALK